MKALKLACPQCRAAAGIMNGTVKSQFTCSSCGAAMPYRDGILCALTPERNQYFKTFLSDYTTIRNAEGRGSEDAAFYRSLPFQDVTNNNAWQWQIRARTYQYLASRLLP